MKQTKPAQATQTLGHRKNQSSTTYPRPSALEPTLTITFLGGLDDVGEKNMAVIEYAEQAIVIDCGIHLGISLPGVNYTICDVSYLQTIKHKLVGYVITHGHLDHIGGLAHIVPICPAPIYGSGYTIGVIERSFADHQPEYLPTTHIVDIDSGRQVRLGDFAIEFIRVTHAIPDPAALAIITPVGTIIASGDFRLDPEPLDRQLSDTARLTELGDQGVLLLLSESSYADIHGRTPTEQTLQTSFTELIPRASGRIFVATFSSNINRIQMIIDATVLAGRRVAIDGRSMIGYIEIAVRQGILKIPKGTIVPIYQAARLPAKGILIICTGGQGEPNAALQRLSTGTHRVLRLTTDDTVIISSSPISGNEIAFDTLSNALTLQGVQLFRHNTHELDGCGPLHVSGHARRDELREMIDLVRPTYFIPVHGGVRRRSYHADIARQAGLDDRHISVLNNGDQVALTSTTLRKTGTVAHGAVLIDQSGQAVSQAIVAERIAVQMAGLLHVSITIHAQKPALKLSVNITTAGSELKLEELQRSIEQAIMQRYGRVSIDRLEAELKSFVSRELQRTIDQAPLLLLDIRDMTVPPNQTAPIARPKNVEQHQRFQDMRARLLVQHSPAA
jgi:ribonuclease J